MDYFCGKGYLSTDKTSREYISVNNFGYTKNIDCDLCIKRERGRLDYQMIYIDKGYGLFLIDGSLKKIESGNVVMIYPGQKNHYEFLKAGAADYYWIHFTGVGVRQLLTSLRLYGSVFNVGNFFEFKKAIDSMSESIAYENFISEPIISATAHLLLCQISRRIYVPESPIHAVIARMQNEKMSDAGNADYARMCGLGECHFLRNFKKVTGTTPHRYMAKITAQKAAEFLGDTSMNITEIALLLGFEDSLYFSRFFKKEMGVSPTKFRNMNNSLK